MSSPSATDVFLLVAMLFVSLGIFLFTVIASYGFTTRQYAARTLVPLMRAFRVFSIVLSVEVAVELTAAYGERATELAYWEVGRMVFGIFLVLATGYMARLAREEELISRGFI